MTGRFQKWTFGKAELIALEDTWARLRPDYFFPDVGAEAFAAYPQWLMANGRMAMSVTCWLIASEGKTILVDTGIGSRPVDFPIQRDPALPSVMAAAGARPEEVDVVVFTHLHFDHTGWNTVDRAGRLAPVFPNARHVIQQREWDYWLRTDREGTGDRSKVLDPLVEWDLVDFVQGEHALTREVVTVPTPGHTPGHVSFLLTSRGESVVVLGDAAHSPMQVPEAHWCAGADIDPATARASRRALWERADREGMLVASHHFPFPGLGRVVSEDGARRYVPSA